MSVVFLFSHEDGSSEPLRLAADMLCGMYGYYLMLIDNVGDLLPVSGEPFKDLDEALADPRFRGWTWVFFDPKAEKGLESFEHPTDHVVYVFGHDVEGLPILDVPGAALHLKSCNHDSYEHHALACLVSVAVQRFYSVDI